MNRIIAPSFVEIRHC